MVRIQGRKSEITRSLLFGLMLMMALGTFSFSQGKRYQSPSAYSFGVMGDTQWTVGEDPEGTNPEYVSAAVAGALQERFIDNGVKFVIQVGDLTDRAGDEGLAARAAAAQPLYDAGIGFFPLRGNHETYGYLYFRDPDNNVNIPAFKSSFPQTQGTDNTFGATNFNSPDVDVLKGLSYSFDYANQSSSARFVIVDIEGTEATVSTPAKHPIYGPGAFYIFWTVYKHTEDLPGIPAGNWFRISSSGKPSTNFYAWDTYEGEDDEYYYPIADNLYYVTGSVAGEYWPGMQQDWISSRLDQATRGTEHAFVFSHRPLLGANHVDGFFGADPNEELDAQNAFYASLANNDVKYMISAHDHIHNHSLLTSPDGLSQVEQQISIGASTKFYAPGSLDTYGDAKQRETQLAQEIFNIGYYIYTVDGPRVTVDYYSDSVGYFMDNENYPRGDDSVPGRLYLPEFDFVKKESWGYSTNGSQFMVNQGEPYSVVQDSFSNTSARILAGTNSSTAKDVTPIVIDNNGTPDDASDDVTLSAPRPFVKKVNTGWIAKPADPKLLSPIFSLWGMANFGTEQTDTYVLSMSFDLTKDLYLMGGGVGIVALDTNNKWTNAVNLNFGGTKNFVLGPYQASHGLGTWGIDYATKTVWAVVNYNADFAVANFTLFEGAEKVVRPFWRIRF